MVRKSNSKRLQVCAPVKKHKMRSKQSIDETGSIENIISQDKLLLFYKTAEKCFGFYGKICCKLHLVPYSFSPDGQLQKIPSSRILIHYAVLSALALSMMHKVAALCHHMFHPDSDAMDVNTAMSIMCVLAYLVTLGTTVSILREKEETVCIINSWGRIGSSLQDASGGGGIFANAKIALLVLYVSGLCFFVGLGFSLIGLVFEDIPISYWAMAVRFGLLNTSGTTALPTCLWKLGLWPLELVTYMVPMIMCGWSSLFNQLITAVINTHLNQLR